jgi:hypothetical protein
MSLHIMAIVITKISLPMTGYTLFPSLVKPIDVKEHFV